MSINPTLLGLRDDAVICGTCQQIRGTALAGFHQRCGCEARPDPDEPRYGYDFPTAAELCRCCALVLLRSGSKWSVWFCTPCKDFARAFNNDAGTCVFPIGRHSLMNGVALRGSEVKHDLAVRRFVRGMTALRGRGAWVSDRAGLAVRQNVSTLGADPDLDLSLSRYLNLAAHTHDPGLTSQSAFTRMVEALDR